MAKEEKTLDEMFQELDNVALKTPFKRDVFSDVSSRH